MVFGSLAKWQIKNVARPLMEQGNAEVNMWNYIPQIVAEKN